MLRLSDLLRHSLYETQKPAVSIHEEIDMVKSYIALESLRLEDDLELAFNNSIAEDAPYEISPLILIVFIENAFKHARFVKTGPIIIRIDMKLEKGRFNLLTTNNFNDDKQLSSGGLGLTNVRRRLEVLYPDDQHHLTISRDSGHFVVNLQLQLNRKELAHSEQMINELRI
jgi:LytS/YehU family sensor histidine kinase